ncbi:MAG: NAD-dependent epimerase/dehydratase family protein [Solirubrobacterales bacterium]
MRILFVGGTGLISSACSIAAQAAGHELWLVTRGRSDLPASVPEDHVITADATNAEELRSALKDRSWDVVVQWIAFTPDQVVEDLETFADAGQYIFISSASVYEKPPSSWLITEQTPTVNPFWDYSQNKIACEEVLRGAHGATGFPMTIVRPTLTYGLSQIPVIVGSWDKPFTIVDRIRRGAKILVPGDGTAIWTLAHNTDFASGLIGLFGQDAAIGEDFHITSDEALTWNQIYALLGDAVGAEPDVLHIPTDALVAADPSQLGSLWGDKSHSAVFDNSKLRSIVPDFKPRTKFADGIRETIAWFDADPSRQAIDDDANALWDRLAAIYLDALRQAADAD